MSRKVITSFTKHDTGEGVRLSYTYSVISEDGNLEKSNERVSCIVMDEGIKENLETISAFLLARETAQ